MVPNRIFSPIENRYLYWGDEISRTDFESGKNYSYAIIERDDSYWVRDSNGNPLYYEYSLWLRNGYSDKIIWVVIWGPYGDLIQYPWFCPDPNHTNRGNQWVSYEEGFQHKEILYSIAPTFTVTFYTNPNVGSISFYYNLDTYTNAQTGNYPKATYNIEAAIPSGYTFNSWSYSGGVTVADPTSASTTAIVNGAGSLTANYQIPPPSETGNLYVYVKDLNNNPIADASVISTSQPSGQPQLSGSTDSYGFVAFNGIKTGSYTIQASKAGYQSGSSPATVNSGQTTTITFNLPSIEPDKGTLSVDTTPVKGEVFVNGQSWGFAPQSRIVNVGIYAVSFGSVSGYVTPSSQAVSVYKEQTTSVTGIYTKITLSAPSGLTATAVSYSQINLAWTDNSQDESDFHIERRTSSSSWTDITTVTANTQSYSDTGLSASTTYYYRLRAHRHSDETYSAYSNEVSATTLISWKGSYLSTYYSGLGKKVAELHISSEDVSVSGTARYVAIVQVITEAGSEVSGSLPLFGGLFDLLFKAIGEAVAKNPDGSYDFTALEVTSGWGWFYGGSLSKGTAWMTISWWPIPIVFFDLPTPGYFRLYYVTETSYGALSTPKDSVTLVSLHDPEGRLYLHVYDSKDNHVGINYGTNSTEIEIEGAQYIEWNTTTLVFLPTNVSDFRVIIDSQYADHLYEDCSLGVAEFREGAIHRQNLKKLTIEKGEEYESNVHLTEEYIKINFVPTISILNMPQTIVIEDALPLSLNVSDFEGIRNVKFNLLDSKSTWHNYTALYANGLYAKDIDTSGLPIGAYNVYVSVMDNEGVESTQVYGLQILGKLSLRGVVSKAEAVSGETLTITLTLEDQDEQPVGFGSVNVTFAGRTYGTQYSGEGRYVTTIDTRDLVGDYIVEANASKQMYLLASPLNIPLTVRPWWWPYLPYLIGVPLLVALLLTSGILLKRSRRPMIKPPEEGLIVASPEVIQALEGAKDSLEKGMYAPAVISASERLRSDLINRLRLKPSSTNEEIIETLNRTNIGIDHREVRPLLKLADRCKFGEYVPTKKEAGESLEKASNILRKLGEINKGSN